MFSFTKFSTEMMLVMKQLHSSFSNNVQPALKREIRRNTVLLDSPQTLLLQVEQFKFLRLFSVLHLLYCSFLGRLTPWQLDLFRTFLPTPGGFRESLPCSAFWLSLHRGGTVGGWGSPATRQSWVGLDWHLSAYLSWPALACYHSGHSGAS